MKSETNPALQKFTRFDPSLVHRDFPGINLLQLEAGSLQGWIFSTNIGPYHVTAGSFNRTLLYEGTYNPGIIHIGFILTPEHSAVVQAHEYDAGTLAVNRGAVSMHEVFPSGMVWADISASEKTMLEGISYSKKKLDANPQLIIKGTREDLLPLTQLIGECLNSFPIPHMEDRLKTALHNLLLLRFNTRMHEEPFSAGDLFRMRLLEETHKLAQMHKHQPLSLDEICKPAGMKRRTVQKYFHETYGMGPTEYFRVRRLNGTRSDLINGASSVSEVALRWEFNHLGRFAGRYKSHFGESPKETRDRFAVSPKG